MVLTGRTQQAIDNGVITAEQTTIINEAQTFLDGTDKYVARAYETGEPIYPDLRLKRTEARATIVAARLILSELPPG